jgi:hypothetical protein
LRCVSAKNICGETADVGYYGLVEFEGMRELFAFYANSMSAFVCRISLIIGGGRLFFPVSRIFTSLLTRRFHEKAMAAPQHRIASFFLDRSRRADNQATFPLFAW